MAKPSLDDSDDDFGDNSYDTPKPGKPKAFLAVLPNYLSRSNDPQMKYLISLLVNAGSPLDDTLNAKYDEMQQLEKEKIDPELEHDHVRKMAHATPMILYKSLTKDYVRATKRLKILYQEVIKQLLDRYEQDPELIAIEILDEQELYTSELPPLNMPDAPKLHGIRQIEMYERFVETLLEFDENDLAYLRTRKMEYAEKRNDLWQRIQHQYEITSDERIPLVFEDKTNYPLYPEVSYG